LGHKIKGPWEEVEIKFLKLPLCIEVSGIGSEEMGSEEYCRLRPGNSTSRSLRLEIVESQMNGV
jgi:hypothetical protein